MTNVMLLINGEVLTVNEKDEVKQGVAIKDNKIIAVGTNKEILKLKNSSSRVIDLKEKTLIPGFIDPHMHITMYGTNKLSISCKELNSIDELLQAISEKSKVSKKGEWIRAWGFNENQVIDKRYPTLGELDSVCDENPILITRACGHISIVNSKALSIAGINKKTPQPSGGRIGVDSNGELSGLLIESASTKMNLIAKLSKEEMVHANKIASEDFMKKGITSIHDAGGQGLENLHALQLSSNKDYLKQRIYTMVGSLHDDKPVVEHIISSGIFTGLGDHKFKIGPVKLFLDGSSSGPTIWTRQPYTSDPNNYGIYYFNQEEVDEAMIKAHKEGWQITVHAQGDAAIDMILNTIEKANELYPRPDARHRIEHAGLATKDLVKRMKEQGVIPTPNPAFNFEYGDSYVKNYGERGENYYPLGDLLKAGIPAAIASDCPVTDFSPLRGIHSAMTRKTKEGRELAPKQKITFMEALRMYTINGAYSSFEENVKGSIETGKLADMVLFDRSLVKTDIDKLVEAKVEWTMLDGEFVYKRNEQED